MMSTQTLPDSIFFSGHRTKLPPPLHLRPKRLSPSTTPPPALANNLHASTSTSSAHQQPSAELVSHVLAALSLTSPGTRVLDLCTSTGSLAITAREKYGAEVIGVESDRGSLDVVRSQPGAEGVRWVEGDVSRPEGWVSGVGMGDGKWERVVCCGGLALLPTVPTLIAWSRLLSSSSTSTLTFSLPTSSSSPRDALLSSLAASYGLSPQGWLPSSEQAIRDAIDATATLAVRSLTRTGVLSRRTVTLSGAEVWEESVKTHTNPFSLALAAGTLSPAQFAAARQSFIHGWETELAYSSSGGVEEREEYWIVVCGLKDVSS